MAYTKKQLKKDYGLFVKKIGRKREAGYDPNDRHYDRRIEEMLKKMPPEEIAELMEEWIW